jgi:hypothetical protein
MDPSLGARLRAQREQQQVALSAISDATKIKLSILEGLERDDVSQWPEGIYRRAYVRAYARAVGLEPEALVREFLEWHPDPIVPVAPAAETELENPPWPSGLRRLVTSAMAAIPSRRHAGEADKPREAADLVNEPVATPEAPCPLVLPEADPRALDAREEDPPRREPSLMDAAELCTRLGQAVDTREVRPILEDAASALDAVGMVVWSWDRHAAVLRPSLACGYPDATLARIARVRGDSDNAIASAFQSAQMCVVNGGDDLTGAVVVPLVSHTGCAGVLAIELRHGDEQRESVRAFATILAAQIVALVASAPLVEAVSA